MSGGGERINYHMSLSKASRRLRGIRKIRLYILRELSPEQTGRNVDHTYQLHISTYIYTVILHSCMLL